MTDKEIIQALRTCVMDPDDGGDCENCPASRSEGEYCLTAVMSEAASLIEQLIDENAALREKQRWQPVLTGNPERKACYLVTVLHWLDGLPVAREAFWNGVDWLSCERRHEITPRVTHWMPLPGAAEEK